MQWLIIFFIKRITFDQMQYVIFRNLKEKKRNTYKYVK